MSKTKKVALITGVTRQDDAYLAEQLLDKRYDALIEPSRCPLINVGSCEDLSMLELAETITIVVGY